MAQQIIKGDDLMVFDSVGKSIAYATSHTLTISADAVDVSTKDHGIWKGSEVNKINWSISSENLYTDNAYDALFDAMLTRQPVKVWFGKKVQTDADKTVVNDDYPFYTGGMKAGAIDDTQGEEIPAADIANSGYYGLAFITNLTANANTGENATFSVEFTGTGKIAKAAMDKVTSVKITDDNTPDFE